MPNRLASVPASAESVLVDVRGAHEHCALLDAFRTLTPLISTLPIEVDEFDALTDGELLDVQQELVVQRRMLEARAVLLAGQIARRSAPELGSSGLAQRGGYRTPEEMLRVATGSSAVESRSVVRLGVSADESHRGGRIDQVTGEHTPPSHPWMSSVARAVVAATISVAASESIRNGLGNATETITSAVLADAAATLIAEAEFLDPDRLYRRARELRDALDADGIATREEERRAARSLRLHRRADGTGRLVWEMDPETLAIVRECYDQLTSPRRGGPRFVDTSPDRLRAERILSDSRTTEQLASDDFLDLLRAAAEVAPTQLLGLRRPAVRVLVAASALSTRRGLGHLEGQPDPVSIATVERIACADGTLPITFDGAGQPLNVGREHRLFTRKQRVALAARDGGCRWPGCERPPAWTEAHHIQHWVRDNGSTDVAEGILLCRHHHLLAHNNGWEISRNRAEYWLVPPPDIDPSQKPIAMLADSPAVREMLCPPVPVPVPVPVPETVPVSVPVPETAPCPVITSLA